MELSNEELKTLYQAVIQPTAASNPPHPDPLGYLARAIILSGGDPDYVDIEGNVGFMPVDPDRAFQETGGAEVQSLQGNVITTLAMDMQFFQRTGSIEGMIIAFHETEGQALSQQPPSKDMKQLLDALPKARTDLSKILFPRRATVRDVIQFMKDAIDESSLPKYQLDFFKSLVEQDNG